MKKIIPLVLVIALAIGGAYYFVTQQGAQPTVVTTTEDEIDVQAFYNSNTDSEIALILKAENGEGVVVTRRLNTGEEKIDNLVLVGGDGSHATITPNDQGFAARYEDGDGNVIQYANYTDSTVDITVIQAGGKQTVLDKYEHGIDLSKNLSASLIPAARAADESTYYYGGTGLLLNSAGCAAGLIGSPLAPISCAVIIARVGGYLVSQVVEIPGCGKGEELVDCALNNYKDYSEQKIINGLILNSTTNTPINGVYLSLKNRLGKELYRATTDATGTYSFAVSGGVSKYTLTAFSDGYDEGIFTILESGRILRIVDEAGNALAEKEVATTQSYTMWHDFLLKPDGVIRGEVIDSESGSGINNAQISVSPLGLKEASDGQGKFIMFPRNLKERTEIVMSVSAKGYTGKSLSYTLLSVIEVGDQYKMINGGIVYNGIIKLDPEEEEEEEDDEKETEEPKDDEEEDEKPEEKPEIIPVPVKQEDPGFDGQYSEDFDRPSIDTNQEQGIVITVSERSYGTIKLTVTGDKAECHIDLSSTFTSAITGSVSLASAGEGNAYMSTSGCSGGISDDGAFNLTGTLSGEATVAGQTVQSSGPVTVVGQVAGGHMWGEIQLSTGAEAIPFGNKPTEVKGFDGNWLGITIDTSTNEDCTGEQFNVTVAGNEMSGYLSGKIEDGGSFSTAIKDKNGERVLFWGEFGKTYAEGSYKSDPFLSDCSGTLTMQKQ